MTPAQINSLAAFAPAAVANRASQCRLAGTWISDEVIVAQWAAETGWSLDRVSGDWNLFGLTSATCPARPGRELSNQRGVDACPVRAAAGR